MRAIVAMSVATVGLFTCIPANAVVVDIPDALDQTGNYNVTTDIDDIIGEEEVYIVGTMEISNPSNEYLFGTLFLEISTSAPGGAGQQRIGMGNVVNTNDWGVNGTGNISSGNDVVLDTPTTMVLKLNQLTGDWGFWYEPDLNAAEPAMFDLDGNNLNIIDGIGYIRLRGGRYGGIPVNTNLTDYTDVSLYYDGDSPFAGGGTGTDNPGDYNDDGFVDLADYTVWRNNLGSSVTLPNDDVGGVIGTGQYDQWKGNFGDTGGSLSGISSSVVPEPSSLVLLVSIAGLGLWRVRHLH